MIMPRNRNRKRNNAIVDHEEQHLCLYRSVPYLWISMHFLFFKTSTSYDVVYGRDCTLRSLRLSSVRSTLSICVPTV